MNTELVNIQDYDGKPCISARRLHEALQSKRQFMNWFDDRKEGYVEGEDFLTQVLKSTGGRPATEIYLTIDMAKEISMLERNEIGHKIRKYFIEVEKRFFEGIRTKKELRLEAKQVRRAFTDTLKVRGYDKAYHFIQTSKQMRKALGITAKKDEMTILELAKTKASESLAEVAIIQKDAHGYQECNPICIESCQQVNTFTRQQIAQ